VNLDVDCGKLLSESSSWVSAWHSWSICWTDGDHEGIVRMLYLSLKTCYNRYLKVITGLGRYQGSWRDGQYIDVMMMLAFHVKFVPEAMLVVESAAPFQQVEDILY
jgi:hypothetical protein